MPYLVILGKIGCLENLIQTAAQSIQHSVVGSNLTGVEDSEAVLETFSDIAHIAQSCRFQDCTHGSEPDCAVKQALEDGSLDADRFKRFCRMRDEAIRRSQDLRTSRANQRAQSKNNTQGRRAAMKQKGRSN